LPKEKIFTLIFLQSGIGIGASNFPSGVPVRTEHTYIPPYLNEAMSPRPDGSSIES